MKRLKRNARKRIMGFILSAAMCVSLGLGMDMGTVYAAELQAETVQEQDEIPMEFYDGESQEQVPTETAIGEAAVLEDETSGEATQDELATAEITTDTQFSNEADLVDSSGEYITFDGTYDYTQAYQILDLVNQERAAAGLSALTMDKDLLDAAMLRAAETAVLFDHTRPNGTSCFTVSSKCSGENIAINWSVTGVMDSWMESSGHKANILGSGYKSIGIGVFYQDGYIYYVQCFGRSAATTTAKPANKNVRVSVEVSADVMADADIGILVDDRDITPGKPIVPEPYLVNLDWSYASIDILPSNFAWNSSNTGIATIDSNGTITGVSNGSITATAILKVSPYSIFTASFTTSGFATTGSVGSEEETVTVPESDVVVSYRTHVQTYGWQSWVTTGKTSGTSGASKRLEGIEIKVSGNSNLGIRYKTHVQTYGWQDWVADGKMSGTSGESKRLEAICIELTGSDKDKYDIYYRVHAQNYGWLGWAKNGTPAGTAGQSKRLEAIQIAIVYKGEVPSGNIGYSYIELGKSASNTSTAGMVNYMTHVQNYGDQSYVYDGSVSGTFNESKRLESIRIQLNNELIGMSGGIGYITHVQTYGWQGDENDTTTWQWNGEASGTSGESKRLEAIRIVLSGEVAEAYDVYYRVHAQTYGWLGWAKNGEPAGTAGYSRRLEGIQIVLLPKGSNPPSHNPGVYGAPAYLVK